MAKKIKKITKIEPVSKPYEPERISIQRICAYCRVSTGSAEQKNSFDAQVAYYTKLIGSREGWVCVGIYADEARSGTKTDRRDDFQRMVQDCRDGKIDLIITKSVTRFARNTVDSIRTIRELKTLGVGVYFEKERVNTLSEKSEQLLTVLSSIAQGESESISTNNKWSAIRRFQNGTFIISDPAYGYANNEDGELVIQPEEACVVRRIFDEYLGGKGSYVIAKELRKEGIPTIRNSEGWQDSVVKGILRNCVYEGDPEQERETRELEQKIQELKKQSHMLSKVLTGGGIDSAVFIEKRNQIDAELEAAWRRLQQLKNQKLFEQEILQTEYLLTVFKNRPAIIEEYEEELFLMTVEQITVLKHNLLSFRLKNGLELEEGCGERKGMDT